MTQIISERAQQSSCPVPKRHQFQTVGIRVSSRLVNLLPYVAVIVVLTAWGKTRMPSSVGEPYETEE